MNETGSKETSNNTNKLTRQQLVEGEHYYINESGLFVFTEKYHLQRGYCCKNGCKHCPWGYNKCEEVQMR